MSEEGYLELTAPILRDTFVQSLELNAAGRMTDYSTSGLVETWKLGFISQLIDDVRLRGTWSVDIRAPSIQELFAPANVNTGSAIDPKTGKQASIINNVLGNPTLAPEGCAHRLGRHRPDPDWLPGFNFSLDWYNINMTGQINTVSQNLILSTCTANINDPTVLGAGVRRGERRPQHHQPRSDQHQCGSDLGHGYPVQLHHRTGGRRADPRLARQLYGRAHHHFAHLDARCRRY
jgi:hypothetical protein